MSFNDPLDNPTLKIINGENLSSDYRESVDAIVVGTGSGGGMAAHVLAEKGYRIFLLEEGPLKLTRDFKQNEADAYPQLYQESAGRLTKDKGIKILQGRCVGGGTTVNWTTSFRTPKRTLDWWQSEWEVKNCSREELDPFFSEVEKKVGIHSWTEAPPNENNDILKRGLEKLDIPHGLIKRNVIDCHNLGYCGMGCPVGAKQSTLVNLIPGILEKENILGHSMRCERVLFENGKATGVIVRGKNGSIGKIQAKLVILSGGAIGTPSVLKRSLIVDPHCLVGKRTFVHPVCLSGAMMEDEVEAWQGAPQVVYSDHFLDSRPFDGKIGFKLEVPPIHPVILSTVIEQHGEDHRYIMERFPKFHAIISLLRDGFHDESIGGEVYLKSDGTPGLDYKITPYVWQGIQDSWLASAEIQFAAGAKMVWPIHRHAPFYRSWSEAKKEIKKLPLEILKAKIVSAHVMGGCPMSEDPKRGVVDSFGRHHQVENLYIMDGSVFPTSVAANPMESILAMSLKNARSVKINM